MFLRILFVFSLIFSSVYSQSDSSASEKNVINGSSERKKAAEDKSKSPKQPKGMPELKAPETHSKESKSKKQD